MDRDLSDNLIEGAPDVANVSFLIKSSVSQVRSGYSVTINDIEVPFEEPPFMSEEEFYPEAEFDFPPPEVMESFEIF